ncbi:hypothetical protein Nepgr_013995 [Nepenthes gracilis]|uniref:Protein saal1 n=1 Tax=Nepenthes gracilis TaxID=150966 RepID=A0AAD3SK20_NEPGR|nr:hypothetical protein Nepgr_013995 [Nepenthes gracilis]
MRHGDHHHKRRKEEEEREESGNGPLHHPSAPADELFDISTTVDPSYIISLIRKLLHPDERNDYNAQGDDPHNDSSGRLKIDCVEEGTASPYINGAVNHNMDAMETRYIDFNHSPKSKESDDGTYCGTEHPKTSTREEAWEESGCILWDLAANQYHARLMVENLVLEVLLVNLTTPGSVRITEISLGIIGNLACHEALMKQIISTKGLMETIIDQVFLDDTPCLCEACRLLTLGLQGPERATWASALQSEHILNRVLWIAENALNPQLVEKSVGLLLAMVENQHEVASILLPILKNMRLLEILVNLLSFETGKLTSERMPERYPALDSILGAIEALSAVDDFSQEICSNKELFRMATELVKLPDKTEIANSCVTSAVLIANILTDSADLASEMSKDLLFLQCLFDLYPFTSDDFEARNALWSIVARLLVQVRETEMNSSSLAPYVSALVSKSDHIEDDLLDYQSDSSPLKHDNSTPAANSNFRTIALKRIISILNEWNRMKNCMDDESSSGGNCADDGDVSRLLECCLKHES